MIKHYAQFRYAGSTRGYYVEKEVEERDISKVEIPEDYSSVRFLDRDVITLYNGAEVKSYEMNMSGWYYVGKEMLLKDAKSKLSKEKYENFEMQGYKRVVFMEDGRVAPLVAIDQVITRKKIS